jgi:hypothetical protein
MDRLERGVSSGFIVFDLERFTRQPKDGERMIELAARGLGVLDSESEYDLTTPNGKKALMALRGKHLVIQPAQRGRGSADQADIVRRITIEYRRISAQTGH